MLALSAAALGCSAANPSSQPSNVTSERPTPSETPAALPSSTTGAGGSPIAGCPDANPDLRAILAVDPAQRPVCFGRSAVTFQAVVVAATVDCVPVQVEPAWLWCPPAAFLAPAGTADSLLRSELIAWARRSAARDDAPALAAAGVPMLEVHVAPGSEVTKAQFVPGRMVQVTGHFDDANANDCRVVAAQPGWIVPTPAEVALACREAFVVTSLGPGSA